MKYSINVNYESESLEDDLGKLADMAIQIFGKYEEIVAKNKTQSSITDLREDVHGLDNRLDGLEASLDQFKEVVTEKASDKKVSK